MKKKPLNKLHYSLLDELMADGLNPLPEEYRTHQLGRMRNGFNNLSNATNPSIDDWIVCADAINLMETLVEDMHICEDSSGLLSDAIAAMKSVGKTVQAQKLTETNMQAIEAVINDYADVVEVLSARTMVRCHRLTEKKLHKILDKKPKQNVVPTRFKMETV